MNIFDGYTHAVLSQLNCNKVQYLVVGGYAVNYHGYRRTTGDIDLWIKPENGINKEQIIQSLRNLAVDESTLIQLTKLDFTKPVIFVDGEEPFKIDFMTFVSGVNFESAFNKKNIAEIDHLQVPFIHLNDLVLSKMSTDRPQDKIDVEKLQQIQLLKNKK